MFSIQELIETFQRALCALTPLADELRIPWREPDNYHDWDGIASGIFDGFVLAPIKAAMDWGAFMPLIQYDQRVSNYNGYSFVAASIGGVNYPFICLETSSATFDTCLLAEIDNDQQLTRYIRVQLAECKCLVVAKGASDAVMLEAVPL